MSVVTTVTIWKTKNASKMNANAVMEMVPLEKVVKSMVMTNAQVAHPVIICLESNVNRMFVHALTVVVQQEVLAHQTVLQNVQVATAGIRYQVMLVV